MTNVSIDSSTPARLAVTSATRSDALPDVLWQEIKLQYVSLLTNHKQPELAETFFNSVIKRIVQRSYYDNDLIFVRAAISTEYIESDPPIYRSYYPNVDGKRECFAQLFRDFGWSRPFADLDRDLDHVLRAFEERPGRPWTHLEPNYQIQVLNSAFFRNKAAYVFGKLVNGHDELPFVVPVLHEGGGRLELDTTTVRHADVSVAHMWIESQRPEALPRAA
mgnify:CR=1 FL=1